MDHKNKALSSLKGFCVNFLLRNKPKLIFNDFDYFHYCTDKTDNDRLLAILKHATNTVNFYKDYINKTDIKDFPIVNKSIIKNNYNDFVSNAYNINSLKKVTTSGSTGTPFTYYLDKNKKFRREMEAVYYNGWAGYKLGDKHLINAVGVKKSKLKLFFQNELISNPMHMDSAWLEEQRKLLQSKRIIVYIGYASAITHFANFCKLRGDDPKLFNLKGIIAGSEKLDNNARKIAEEVFGCLVLSKYSSLETGVIAHECPECKTFHINTSSYYVELLALDSDNPASDGEIGRIVITDLFSYGMPLIRYDIGDLAIKSSYNCSCGRISPTFKHILGRQVENVTDQNGNYVSWVAINDAMWPYSDVEQFLFVQLDKTKYKMQLKVKEECNSVQNIENDFRALLGDDIDFTIEFVDDIPPLKSGKRPYIINQYLKDKFSN